MQQPLTSEAFDDFMEDMLPELQEIDPEFWPRLCCVQSVIVIMENLTRLFEGDWAEARGQFTVAGLPSYPEGAGPYYHMWVQDEASGVILDPTIGQFTGDGKAWAYVTPGSEHYWRFKGEVSET